MTHFIYPDCPECGKANGVRLNQFFDFDSFLYKCSQCNTRSKGEFDTWREEITWLDVDVSLFEWFQIKLFY